MASLCRDFLLIEVRSSANSVNHDKGLRSCHSPETLANQATECWRTMIRFGSDNDPADRGSGS